MIAARRHIHRKIAFIPAPRRIRTYDTSDRAVEGSTQRALYRASAVIGGGFVGALNSVSMYVPIPLLS